jgi:hypothetical protein
MGYRHQPAEASYSQEYNRWLDRVARLPVIIEDEPMPDPLGDKRIRRRILRQYAQIRRLGAIRG